MNLRDSVQFSTCKQGSTLSVQEFQSTDNLKSKFYIKKIGGAWIITKIEKEQNNKLYKVGKSNK
jgi:hypothetical protein